MPHYVRSEYAPDTELFCFSVKHDYPSTQDGDAIDRPDTGFSPISRWLAWAVDFDDFVSNPDAVGYIARCQIPRGTIGMQCFARVDTAFAAAGGAADIDIGDGTVTDGWMNGNDWQNTGLHRDANAVYNDLTSDAAAGATGYQLYATGDTLDILWKNATAPTAGYAIVFLRTVSYHEPANTEWATRP